MSPDSCRPPAYYCFLSTGGATSTITPGLEFPFLFVAGAISLIVPADLLFNAGAISLITPRDFLAISGAISGATSTITPLAGRFRLVIGATSVTRDPAFFLPFLGGATSTIGRPFGLLPGATSTTGPYGFFFLGGATSTITPGFFRFFVGRFLAAILILLICLIVYENIWMPLHDRGEGMLNKVDTDVAAVEVFPEPTHRVLGVRQNRCIAILND